MASAAQTPTKIQGVLTFNEKDTGRFIGGLNKHVRGKTARQVFREYSKKFDRASEEDQKKMVSPKEIGHIAVRVNVNREDGEVSHESWLENEKVSLEEFNGILEKNIQTHASQFSRPTPVEDRFTHKFAAVAALYHQGMIGKFLGGGGKNVKRIADDIAAATGLPSCFINIRDASEEHDAKRPFKNRFVRIECDGDCPFEAIITVSVNLKNGENPEEIMGKITRVLVPAVKSLGAPTRTRNEPEFISADAFLGGLDFGPSAGGDSPCYTPPSPTYSPGGPATVDDHW